jgi:hypothetical protein
MMRNEADGDKAMMMAATMADVHMPVIALHSTAGGIARPHHVEPYAARRNGEAKTIHK